MAKKRTFIDAGVLIHAARGTHELSEKALAILDDPERFYVTSDFVQLEVLPKAIYHQQTSEADFYRTYFTNVGRTVKASASLVAEALAEAQVRGLSAVDALHIAASKRANCAEFITAEKPTKPLFNATGVAVTSIHAPTGS